MRKFLVVLALLRGCAHSTGEKVLLKPGAYVLDVRSPGEFAEGHLKGAVNIPVDELEATLPSMPTDRNRQIAVYCRNGLCSARARGVLLKAGFAKVEDLGGLPNLK